MVDECLHLHSINLQKDTRDENGGRHDRSGSHIHVPNVPLGWYLWTYLVRPALYLGVHRPAKDMDGPLKCRHDRPPRNLDHLAAEVQVDQAVNRLGTNAMHSMHHTRAVAYKRNIDSFTSSVQTVPLSSHHPHQPTVLNAGEIRKFNARVRDHMVEVLKPRLYLLRGVVHSIIPITREANEDKV